MHRREVLDDLSPCSHTDPILVGLLGTIIKSIGLISSQTLTYIYKLRRTPIIIYTMISILVLLDYLIGYVHTSCYARALHELVYTTQITVLRPIAHMHHASKYCSCMGGSDMI